MTDPAAFAGVVLAGGLARRMGGGDKPLRTIGGEPMLARVIARAKPQTGALVLNANGDPARFAAYGLPVAADVLEGRLGPLAGILTGMEWARAHAPGARRLVSFAADAPFLPLDMTARLAEAAEADGADIVCARSNGRAHPVFALWSLDLAEDLRRAMTEEGVRKIDAWTARHALVHVDFPADEVDPFFNVNSPENLAEAEALAARLTAAYNQ
ncbi:MAG: molybdenum cofactor guanylyltransferase MobA [Rhodospirillales bacterium]